MSEMAPEAARRCEGRSLPPPSSSTLQLAAVSASGAYRLFARLHCRKGSKTDEHFHRLHSSYPKESLTPFRPDWWVLALTPNLHGYRRAGLAGGNMERAVKRTQARLHARKADTDAPAPAPFYADAIVPHGQ
ncbi:hypothetical protein DEV91_11451 [Phyllobacterium brassicacearum]|nr:hypothetical protein DEV91_11451 [Phyllobacterium brassicacearum]